jgi:hypothetical protein
MNGSDIALKNISEWLGRFKEKYQIRDEIADIIDEDILRDVLTQVEQDKQKLPKDKWNIYSEAGLITFWFKKLHPLRCKKSRMMNETAAIFCGISYIGMKGRRIPKLMNDYYFLQDFSDILRYKPTSPHMISLVFRGVWEGHNLNQQ